MRRVYIATQRLDAYLLRDALAHRGIEARVFNEYAQGGLGDIPFDAVQPQVWVDAQDFERALKVVDEFKNRRDAAPSKVCPNCAEINPGSFELCWKCGAGLESPCQEEAQ